MNTQTLFSGRPMIILCGIVLGAVASFLAFQGNPGNMGLCASCLLRDSMGALNLVPFDPGRYLRPELFGLILGAFCSALVARDFKPKVAATTWTPFALGLTGVIGTLIFLGCPWRVVTRLAGGDLSALWGLIGMLLGIALGTWIIHKRFTLGHTHDGTRKISSYFFIIFAVVLFILSLTDLPLESVKGPGSMHAPYLYAFGGAFLVGICIQRAKFCTIGAFRNILTHRNFDLFFGIAAFFLTALICNVLFGQFKLGFTEQPIAHNDWLLSLSAMFIAGLSFTLSGGCPGRHITRTGEGDAHSMLTVLGMIVGVVLVHTYKGAASAGGAAPYSWHFLAVCAIIIGLVVMLNRENF